MISYPASTGRNFVRHLSNIDLHSYLTYTSLIQDEIVRVIDSLQLGDKYRITTPVNWQKGDDVIVHPTVSNEEAKTLFPEFTIHKVFSFYAYHLIY
jgi:20S proteasome subunit alpha 2